MKNELVIERTFRAPVATVWRYWTEPKLMKQWHGPKNFTCPAAEIDFRVGGKYLLCMRGGEGLSAEFAGKDYWSTGRYKEIVPLEKIVSTDSFADKNGKVVPASDYGMKGSFPLEMEVTVEFEEVAIGNTKMTLTHKGMPKGEQMEGARVGWNESFDKLRALVN